MSNKISRRTFLKCTGASAAALGTAALLGGCQSSSNASVEVKVGDKVSNWNNPDVPGHEYVAVLVTAVNRSSSVTFNIGAPNIAEINAAYPLNTDAAKAANTAPYFHALSASTTDFAVVCDGADVESGAYISLYDSTTETFTDAPSLPPQRSGYIELVCMVPTGWQQITVTYTPTFVTNKTLTFSLSASDVAKA